METKTIKLFRDAPAYSVTGVSSSIAHLKPSHVSRARNLRKTTAIALYRSGALSVAQIRPFEPRPSDHLVALETCRAQASSVYKGAQGEAQFMADLISAGVDLHRVETVRKQLDTKAEKHATEHAYRVERPLMVVRKAEGVVVKPKVQPLKLTAHQIAVRDALEMANARAEKQAQIDRLRAELSERNLADTMSAEQKAELLAKVHNPRADVTLYRSRR